jgi:hypothetical protein
MRANPAPLVPPLPRERRRRDRPNAGLDSQPRKQRRQQCRPIDARIERRVGDQSEFHNTPGTAARKRYSPNSKSRNVLRCLAAQHCISSATLANPREEFPYCRSKIFGRRKPRNPWLFARANREAKNQAPVRNGTDGGRSMVCGLPYSANRGLDLQSGEKSGVSTPLVDAIHPFT